MTTEANTNPRADIIAEVKEELHNMRFILERTWGVYNDELNARSQDDQEVQWLLFADLILLMRNVPNLVELIDIILAKYADAGAARNNESKLIFQLRKAYAHTMRAYDIISLNLEA